MMVKASPINKKEDCVKGKSGIMKCQLYCFPDAPTC